MAKHEGQTTGPPETRQLSLQMAMVVPETTHRIEAADHAATHVKSADASVGIAGVRAAVAEMGSRLMTMNPTRTLAPSLIVTGV